MKVRKPEVEALFSRKYTYLFPDTILLGGWEGLKFWLFTPKNRVTVKRLFRLEETKMCEDPSLHFLLFLYNQSEWENEEDSVKENSTAVYNYVNYFQHHWLIHESVYPTNF